METRRIVVKGLVQGIGYRPFVAELAEQLHISGWVRNTDGIVIVLASGEPEQLDELERRIKEDAPGGAWVEQLVSKPCPPQRFDGFSIVGSERRENERSKAEIPLLPADLPTCGRCASELHDGKNRRFRHPFISCTACGPRYSILEEIPYDREHISMKRFPLCPVCGREYRSPGNVRRHAQTIACKNCGPALRFRAISGGEQAAEVCGDAAMDAAVRLLGQGGILAVKDIGGYHLAASPFLKETVLALRRVKGRERKPFAILFPDAAAVRDCCQMDGQEEALLTSDPRPIVLLLRKKSGDSRFCAEVCGSSPDVGAMLPCNPVQILLAEALGPLIMTSANGSGELLITDNAEMAEWMEAAKERTAPGVSLGILSHDRPICAPLDDSIVRVVCGKKQTLRRARGMVPTPVPFSPNQAVLAAGGDLKACFCYTGQGRAYPSQHLGDLFDESCFCAYRGELSRMERLFGFAPKLLACDLHPGYRSSALFEGMAKENGADIPLVRIQHHRAHVASVIAEHGLEGGALGFAFDGTGYGDDGAVWGSEVFLWDGRCMERKAHLKPVLLTGGDEGARNADASLYGYMASLSDGTAAALLGVLKQRTDFSEEKYRIVKKALGLGLNCVTSSSMGRLFDAASACLDICHYNSYEGEAAIELENLAATAKEAYPLALALREDVRTGGLFLDAEPLFGGLARGLLENAPAASLARGFLYAVSDGIVTLCGRFAQKQIILSGGTFLNRILLERTTLRLEALGYAVYRSEELPPGDGGICLGQAYLANKVIEEEN